MFINCCTLSAVVSWNKAIFGSHIFDNTYLVYTFFDKCDDPQTPIYLESGFFIRHWRLELPLHCSISHEKDKHRLSGCNLYITPPDAPTTWATACARARRVRVYSSRVVNAPAVQQIGFIKRQAAKMLITWRKKPRKGALSVSQIKLSNKNIHSAAGISLTSDAQMKQAFSDYL